MSFFDTLKQYGLWPQQQAPSQQDNPYGLDEAMMRQARMQSISNLGAQIMAASVQQTPRQRADLMAGFDVTGGYQDNLYNAAQMKLMSSKMQAAQRDQQRMEQAQTMIAEQLKSMPAGRQRDEVMFYLQAGDVQKAAERLYAQASSDAPPMKTIRVGTQDVTYQWDAGQRKWIPFGAGDAFKPTPDTVVNVGGGSDDFDKKLMGGIADAYVDAYKSGAPAQETKTAVLQLRTLLEQNGGALDGFAATVAPYAPEGWLPEGANDLVAAQSIVSGLIPKQRMPGAGATSDYDARMFAQSLPNIWNKPGANEIILDTIEAYSDYRVAVSNIVADVSSDPSISNKSGAIREAIKQLPDPFEQWKQARARIGRGADAQISSDGKTDLPADDLESALGEY